jgi:uncharacterized protein YukE
MQNANFNVDTQLIRGQVPVMEGDLQQFVNCYNAIRTASESLVNVSFKGQTGSQFNQRIMEYQTNINNVCNWVNNYCQEITTYANGIDAAEDQQSALASRLNV